MTNPRSSGSESGPPTGRELRYLKELEEFFEIVRLAYGLPKPKPRPRPVEKPSAGAGLSGLSFSLPRPVLLGAAALAVVATLVWAVPWGGSGGKEKGSLPVELYGNWVTSEPKYAARGFSLTADSVMFKTGKGKLDFTVHPIRKVEVGSAPSGKVYRVTYDVDAKNTASFDFAYETEPPTIRMLNRPDVRWSKERAKPKPRG